MNSWIFRGGGATLVFASLKRATTHPEGGNPLARRDISPVTAVTLDTGRRPPHVQTPLVWLPVRPESHDCSVAHQDCINVCNGTPRGRDAGGGRLIRGASVGRFPAGKLPSRPIVVCSSRKRLQAGFMTRTKTLLVSVQLAQLLVQLVLQGVDRSVV